MNEGAERWTAKYFVRRARSLGFGLLGSAAAYLLGSRYPQLLAGHIGLPALVYLGGLFGAGVFSVVAGMFHPLARFAAYHGKLIELVIQRRMGLLDVRRFNWIKGELDVRYFLGHGDQKTSNKVLTP